MIDGAKADTGFWWNGQLWNLLALFIRMFSQSGQSRSVQYKYNLIMTLVVRVQFSSLLIYWNNNYKIAVWEGTGWLINVGRVQWAFEPPDLGELLTIIGPHVPYTKKDWKGGEHSNWSTSAQSEILRSTSRCQWYTTITTSKKLDSVFLINSSLPHAYNLISEFD